MRRPFGVILIAMLILACSGWVLAKAIPLHASRRAHSFFIASVVLSILALIATEALWSLRSHAFAAFTLWAICAVAAWVLLRLLPGSSAHLIRVFAPIAWAGVAYAAIALYLRRVI